MKKTALRIIAEMIESQMREKNLSPKELAQKAGLSYSSLIPILNGSRECGVTKLLSIANALEVNPNTLLQGLFNHQPTLTNTQKISQQPTFLACFVSIVKITYCLLYNCQTHDSKTCALQMPMRCGEAPDEFIDNILTALESLNSEIDPRDTAVFVSVQQYGRALSRQKIQRQGDRLFPVFHLESDAKTNYRAFIGPKNGICISINDGDVITYSYDQGNTIQQIHGYGFPISDVAGNYWLGCEALKHAIKVKMKQESSSFLSDKILAFYEDNLNYLSESAMTNPQQAYLQASAIVKEMIYKRQKSYEIVEQSAKLLQAEIDYIDKLASKKLPIYIAGELAHFYTPFFEQGRLLQVDEQPKNILLEYALQQLQQVIENYSQKTLS